MCLLPTFLPVIMTYNSTLRKIRTNHSQLWTNLVFFVKKTFKLNILVCIAYIWVPTAGYDGMMPNIFQDAWIKAVVIQKKYVFYDALLFMYLKMRRAFLHRLSNRLLSSYTQSPVFFTSKTKKSIWNMQHVTASNEFFSTNSTPLFLQPDFFLSLG